MPRGAQAEVPVLMRFLQFSTAHLLQVSGQPAADVVRARLREALTTAQRIYCLRAELFLPGPSDHRDLCAADAGSKRIRWSMIAGAGGPDGDLRPAGARHVRVPWSKITRCGPVRPARRPTWVRRARGQSRGRALRRRTCRAST